jgi:hypothetical protein
MRPRQTERCKMLMKKPTTALLLTAALVAIVALSSPALARGGGHHHGECGEHHGGYACGHVEYESHHNGNHEYHVEPYHRSGYQPGAGYPGYQKDINDSGPLPSSGSPPGPR